MGTLGRLLLLGLAVASQEADPGRAGLDPAKISSLRGELQKFVDRREAAGIVTLVGRRGHVGSLEAVGWQDLEKKTPMKGDTIFRIASMTKPVTAMAVLMLEEEGKLSIDDPVAKFVPEFGKVETPRPITLKHLLTHTSGIPGGPPKEMSDLYARRNRTLAEAAPAFARAPQFEPGTKWAYCNTGIDVLGRVVEVASGTSFEAFLDGRLFKPLGMKDTFFYPTEETLARTAVLYKKDGGGLARSENFLGDPVGGKFPLPAGGLYSTAGDLARLYQMMLDRGTRDGRRYLSEASVEKMTRNHTGELKAGFTPGVVMGLGWQVVGAPAGVTEMLSPGAYGHGGAFGTQGWIDPKKGMYFILLVQRSGFGNGDASEIRRVLQSVAVSAVTD
jgi:CubicO group peptidase (beta-lactamase class C family)